MKRRRVDYYDEPGITGTPDKTPHNVVYDKPGNDAYKDADKVWHPAEPGNIGVLDDTTKDSTLYAAAQARQSASQETPVADAALSKLQTDITGVSAAQRNFEDILASMSREKFRYDVNADKLYQLYKDQYTRNGRTAMEDTMARLQMRNGGLGTSYAQMAGQQAYNNYMQQLSNKIPELENLAYQRWSADRKDKIDTAKLAYGLATDQYKRDLDADALAYSRAWQDFKGSATTTFADGKYTVTGNPVSSQTAAPSYKVFDSTLFDDINLTDAEKKAVDSAMYRFYATGDADAFRSEIAAASPNNAEKIINRISAVNARSAADETAPTGTDAKVETKMSSYAADQKKSMDNLSATKSFADYLSANKVQNSAYYVKQYIRDIASVLKAEYKYDEYDTGFSGLGAAIGSIANYAEENAKNAIKIGQAVDTFVKRGLITEEEANDILDDVGYLEVLEELKSGGE